MDLGQLFETISETYYDNERGHAELQEVIDACVDEGESELIAAWEIREQLVAISQAVKALKSTVDDRIGKAIGPGGRARLGDYLVSVRPAEKITVTDGEGLAEFLGDRWVEAIPLKPRKTALRAIATEQKLDPDYALDAFCLVEEGKTSVATIPLDKAPKYAEHMEQGEIRG